MQHGQQDAHRQTEQLRGTHEALVRANEDGRPVREMPADVSRKLDDLIHRGHKDNLQPDNLVRSSQEQRIDMGGTTGGAIDRFSPQTDVVEARFGNEARLSTEARLGDEARTREAESRHEKFGPNHREIVSQLADAVAERLKEFIPPGMTLSILEREGKPYLEVNGQLDQQRQDAIQERIQGEPPLYVSLVEIAQSEPGLSMTNEGVIRNEPANENKADKAEKAEDADRPPPIVENPWTPDLTPTDDSEKDKERKEEAVVNDSEKEGKAKQFFYVGSLNNPYADIERITCRIPGDTKQGAVARARVVDTSHNQSFAEGHFVMEDGLPMFIVDYCTINGGYQSVPPALQDLFTIPLFKEESEG
jgi:hypothetical protein